MTELKTLKDIKSYTVSPIATGILDEKNSDWRWITDVDLRQEAIKWVKFWYKRKEEYKNRTKKELSEQRNVAFFNSQDNQGLESVSLTETTIQWIKHFFNLTEEDLK